MGKIISAEGKFKRRRMSAILARKHPNYALRLEEWLHQRERQAHAAHDGNVKPWKPNGERT